MKSLQSIINEKLSQLKETDLSYYNVFSTVLTDLFILRLNTQTLHWNVKGSNFIEVHKYLDEVLEYLDEYIDSISEDIVQNKFFVLNPITLIGNSKPKILGKTSFNSQDTALREYTKIFEDFLLEIDFILELYHTAEDKGYNKSNEGFIVDLRKEIAKTIWFIESTLTK